VEISTQKLNVRISVRLRIACPSQSGSQPSDPSALDARRSEDLMQRLCGPLLAPGWLALYDFVIYPRGIATGRLPGDERTNGMNVKQSIEHSLSQALQPVKLEVIDESDLHAGHGGAREGGETHYRVRIVSPSFTGKRSVQRHRMVYDALKAEFAGGVHALALTTLTPEEV
jgi:BolA protein